MASTVSHSGWLVKGAMSGKDSWKKRHFRLNGLELSYYETDKPTAKPKGTLRIEASSVVRVHPGGIHKGKTNELEVTFPSAKETLCAVSTGAADDM